MFQINKPGRRSRLVASVASLLMLGTTMPSMAFDPKVEAEIRFQIECAILMITDPVAHVEICNPAPINDPLKSLSDTNSSGPPAPPAPPAPAATPTPPAPPAPPPPPKDNDCPEGQEPTPCGCQYHAA